MGRLTDFFRNLKDKDKISLIEHFAKRGYGLAVEDFAIQMTINMVAGLISKCEFITIEDGKLKKGNEYYRWNYQPNVNQSGTAFLFELVTKLLDDNEALIISAGDQLIIADSFEQEKYAVYPNTYRNVRKEDFTFNRIFREDEVMYFRYSNKKLSDYLSGIFTGYNDLIAFATEKYRRSGGRKGTLDLPTPLTGKEKEQKEQQDIFNKLVKEFMQNADGVLAVPNGLKYTELSSAASQKSASEISDINKLVDEVFGRAAQTVRFPKSLVLGDVANLDSALDEALTMSICPIIDLIETEINRKRYGLDGFKRGYEISINTSKIKHFDILEVAASAEKLISSSLFNCDEIRTMLGEIPLNTWWSQRYVMTKNYAAVEDIHNLGEGGGTDD